MARFKLGEVKVKDLIERRLEVEIHLPITTLKYIPLIIEHANPEDNLCSVLCGIKKRSQAWKNEKEPKKEKQQQNETNKQKQETMESEYKIPPTIFHVDESGLIDYKKGLELYDLKDIKLNDENIKSSDINGLNDLMNSFIEKNILIGGKNL